MKMRPPNRIRATLRRMGRGERVWAAELVLRGAGVLLLCLSALAATRLHHPMTIAPHAVRIAEVRLAAMAVLCGCTGGALAGEGAGLFRLCAVPGRYRILRTRKTP
jgi:hypothetical protein